MCGGNTIEPSERSWLEGLSPLVRGKLVKLQKLKIFPGSIPACAGETRRDETSGSPSGVYPRLCGGNKRSVLAIVKRQGLSPLVRGKLLLENPGHSHWGSIPACAGETYPVILVLITYGVYPRLCGGNTPTNGCAAPAAGLSPLVRGKHNISGFDMGSRGSIPACAGET